MAFNSVIQKVFSRNLVLGGAFIAVDVLIVQHASVVIIARSAFLSIGVVAKVNRSLSCFV